MDGVVVVDDSGKEDGRSLAHGHVKACGELHQEDAVCHPQIVAARCPGMSRR